MKNIRLKKIKKFLCITFIIIMINFTYSSFLYKVQAEDEENAEASTSQIIESQSESLRNIKLYRGSKQI